MWCLPLSVAAFLVIALMPILPSLEQSLSLLLLTSLALMYCCWRWRREADGSVFGLRCMLVLWFACWAMSWGTWQLASRLPEAWERRDIAVAGVVDGLVAEQVVGERRIQRFNFQVQRLQLAGHWYELNELPDEFWFPSRLRLSVYGGATIRGGQGWQWQVRLKRPHGFANPGGFDYERWLLSRGLGATGYVRTPGPAGSGWTRLPELDLAVQVWRSSLMQQIRKLLGQDRSAAVIQALALGERSLLDDDSLSRIQQLGLSHLLAISGLHIGLAATCGWWLGRVLGGALAVWLPQRVAGPYVGWLLSVGLASGYGCLAGFSLATQRALIMLLVAALWFVSARRYSAWLGWWLSMLVVLCLQPLAILEAGFWFSFLAVAVLMVSLSSPVRHWGSRFWLLCRVQLCLFLFIGVLQLFWGMPISLLSPLANLIAIPYISVLVVPLVLLALVLSLLAVMVEAGSVQFLADSIWLLAKKLLDGFWALLDQLSVLPGWLLIEPQQSLPLGSLLLTGVGLMLLLMPLNRWSRALGGMMISTLLWTVTGESWSGKSSVASADTQLIILDVGQGLAVAVGSGEDWLLYDTGPRYSPQFNAAEAVVLPFMRNHAIRYFDWGVVSHWDSDHSGGYEVLLSKAKVEQWLMGASQQRQCAPGHLQVGAWDVVVLGGDLAAGNNGSCVLLLSAHGVRVLLPGDIEHEREQELLQHPLLQSPVDILLAPHHGSITSSTTDFVRRLAPRWVVFSAGYLNRYGHPHPQVTARYQEQGSRLLLTANEGAVRFRFVADEEGEVGLTMDTYRNRALGYWRRGVTATN